MPLHHRDLFDRLLITQAIVQQLPILGMVQPLMHNRFNGFGRF